MKQGDKYRLTMLYAWLIRYSADIMKLVVYGRESVQELESLAQSKFAAVRSKGLRSSFFEGEKLMTALPGLQCMEPRDCCLQRDTEECQAVVVTVSS